jgi:uncharacterized protein (UPF0335 family)
MRVEMIDINGLRQKLQSDDLIDRIDVHANVKPVLTELLDRLEAAEKERALDEQRIADLMADLNRVGHENDAMRAKVERMERQGPVEWQTRTRPAWNDGTWGPWRKCSEEYAEDIKKTPLLHDWLYEARALYALPGAKGEEK